MQKLMFKLCAVLFLVLVFNQNSCLADFGGLGPSTEGNREFAGINRYKLERDMKKEFVENPKSVNDEYKKEYLNYNEGKVDVTPDVKTQYRMTRPGSNNLFFFKDENGKIRIKSAQ